jgi:hypothetical protein
MSISRPLAHRKQKRKSLIEKNIYRGELEYGITEADHERIKRET